MTSNLQSFLDQLDQYEQRLPLDHLTELIANMDISIDDVRDYIAFNDDRYQRNLIHQGPAYQALVLCWKNGQRSPIHDHPGSSCAVRVLRGVVTETVFERRANGMIVATETHELAEGEICGQQDEDIHQISNLQPEGRDLISLHIYSPPLNVVNTYSLTDSTVNTYHDPVNEFIQGAGI